MSLFSRSSGELSAGTNLVRSGVCRLSAAVVQTDGTNDATLTVYDNTAGSGRIIYKVVVKATDSYGGIVFKNPVTCEIGLTAVLAGTGATAYISFV